MTNFVAPDDLTTPENLGLALTARREAANLSVRELAQLIGVPHSTVGGYLRGRNLPNPSQFDTFGSLLSALDIPLEDHPSWLAAVRRVRRRSGQRLGDVNPYRGLFSFGLDDSGVFFGRSQLAAQVLELVDQPERPSGWTALIGASGSGKSSLLAAGVLAQIRAEGRPVRLTTPREIDPSDLQDLEQGTVLGLDQFEEVFAPDFPAERRARLIDGLVELVSGDAVQVVATLRADFLGHCLNEPALVPLLASNQVLVGPMASADLREAIAGPARKLQRGLEDELVELVLSDATSSRREEPDVGVLPLISHVMNVLWEQSRGTIRAADYIAAGRLSGAIQTSADEIWNGLDDPERPRVRRLFHHLVAVDLSGVPTRRPLLHAEAAKLVSSHVLDQFIDARILSSTTDSCTISHEALLSAWPRLQQWLLDDMQALQLSQRIRAMAQIWASDGRREGDLLRGSLLDAVGPEADQVRLTLTGHEREYVAASIEERHRQQRKTRGSIRRLRVLLACVTALTVGSGLLSIALVRAANSARAAEADAESRQLSLQSRDLQETDPALAGQLALAAYRTSKTVEARSALLEASALASTTRALGTPGSMRAVVSPDGALVATASADSTVRMMRRTPGRAGGPMTGSAELTLPDEPQELYAAEFSVDGRLLAVGGSGGNISIIDVSDPTAPGRWDLTLTGPESAVQDLAFGPSGDELAAASSDGKVHRWRIKGTGNVTPLSALTGFTDSVQSVTYDRRGGIAAASKDGTIRLWGPQAARGTAPSETFRIPGSARLALAVDISPDDRLMAVGGSDRRVHLWDLRTKKRIRALGGFPTYVNDVAFSHDGQALAGVGSRGVGHVWSTADGTLRQTLQAPESLTSVAFTPKGEFLVTGALDGITRATALNALPSLPATIYSVAYPADGSRLYASVGPTDSTVHAFDPTDPIFPRALIRERYPFPDVDGAGAVSPDGRTYVAGSMTGQRPVFRLDPQTSESARSAEPVSVLTDNETITQSVAFSTDGQWVATASDSGELQAYPVGASGVPGEAITTSTSAPPLGISFQPGQHVIAVATTDRKITLYRIASSPGGQSRIEQISQVGGFENYAYAASFTADGRFLVGTSSDTTLRIWDITDQAKPEPVGKPLTGPRGTVSAAATSPDGQLIAATADDGIVWIWRLNNKKASLYATLRNLGSVPTTVSFDPRGGALVAGGIEGRLRAWSSDPEAVAEQICRTAGVAITAEEWQRFAPGIPYRNPC